MSGFLPADDRQAALHSNRLLLEHVALFRKACDDNELGAKLADRLTERFFEHLMLMSAASTQMGEMSGAFEALSDTLRKLAEGDEDTP